MTTHYHHDDPQSVVLNFHRDLDSEAGQRFSAELRDLGMPTFECIKPGFEKLSHDLNVG